MLSSVLLLLTIGLEVSARAASKYARIIGPDTASNATYDFIIVGGGIAGLTVADRLTEDPNTSVLVVEWGPIDNNTDGVLVPGLWNPVPYFWPGILSIPQPGLDNAVEFVPMGQVVGGGSAINAMFFHRGGIDDYNGWATLGNPGWGWDGLLPYFKKSENFTHPDPVFAKQHNISYDDSVHGFSGPVHVSYPPFDWAPSKNFWNAALSLGIPPIKDPNGGKAIGLYWFLKALDPTTETRSYAETAHYARVIATRPNYHLLPLHAVSKVLFDGKTAIGANYTSTSTGASSIAHARKEVIVAAGGVHSPQVLQVSGVGPKALIESLGIKSVVNLPGVGTNMQDHLVLTMVYNFSSNLQPNEGELGTNATFEAEQSALYFSSHKGAYTLTRGTGTNTVGLPLKNTTSNYTAIIAAASAENPASILPANTDPTVLAGYKVQRALILSEWESLNDPVGEISWSTGPDTSIFMLKPLSRGTVNIASASILDNPVIDFGALKDENDLELVLGLMKKNRQIMALPEMQILGPTELTPGANITSDDALRATLRSLIVPTNAHMCCTNPMMKLELGGVVDSKLRVYGVSGLSVVDVSVFPFIAAGAPQASVYGAAEKAADIIKKRHGIAT